MNFMKSLYSVLSKSIAYVMHKEVMTIVDQIPKLVDLNSFSGKLKNVENIDRQNDDISNPM